MKRVPDLSAANTPGGFGVKSGNVDLIRFGEVGETCRVLQTLAEIREKVSPDLPAVFNRDGRNGRGWKKKKNRESPRPHPAACSDAIDPSRSWRFVEPLLWMPALQSRCNRRRGTCPKSSGVG